jgi:hypothetical protein
LFAFGTGIDSLDHYPEDFGTEFGQCSAFFDDTVDANVTALIALFDERYCPLCILLVIKLRGVGEGCTGSEREHVKGSHATLFLGAVDLFYVQRDELVGLIIKVLHQGVGLGH